jgi:hypothetical protein
MTIDGGHNSIERERTWGSGEGEEGGTDGDFGSWDLNGCRRSSHRAARTQGRWRPGREARCTSAGRRPGDGGQREKRKAGREEAQGWGPQVSERGEGRGQLGLNGPDWPLRLGFLFFLFFL